MAPDDISEDERRAFDAMPRERDPGRAVEDRIVSALHARGQLARRPRRVWAAPVVAAAALVAAFALGVVFGMRQAAPPDGTLPGPRFMLLLYEGTAFEAAAAGREQERATEYGAWARGLTGGRLIAGDELAGSSRLLGQALAGGAGPQDADRDVRGYFMISAPDEAAAVAIAEGCPHLKYGGTIAVKPVIDH